jgi:hypothetical protein
VHDLQRERFTREKANLEKKSSASPPSPPIPGTVGKKRVSLKKKAEKKKAN